MNYRITFGGEDIDYKKNFADCRKYYEVIRDIFDLFKNIIQAQLDANLPCLIYPSWFSSYWWFFEPYVELTWLWKPTHDTLHPSEFFVRKDGIVTNELTEYGRLTCEKQMLELIEKVLKKHGIEKFTFATPKDGQFHDWYGLTPEERKWGAERYGLVSKLSKHFLQNEKLLEEGLGQERHYMRTFHVLANQLGMNYEEEGMALVKRGIWALLCYSLGIEQAVSTYEKLFKEKYM